jgi:predicted transcriptional regulator
MVQIREIIESLSLKVFAQGQGVSVERGYTGDLLSLVIGSAPSGALWITVQRHINIVAVAALKEIPAILIAQGLEPEEDVVQKAKEEKIWLLGSPEDAFTLSGKVYQLLQGGSLPR